MTAFLIAFSMSLWVFKFINSPDTLDGKDSNLPFAPVI